MKVRLRKSIVCNRRQGPFCKRNRTGTFVGRNPFSGAQHEGYAGRTSGRTLFCKGMEAGRSAGCTCAAGSKITPGAAKACSHWNRKQAQSLSVTGDSAGLHNFFLEVHFRVLIEGFPFCKLLQ